MTDKSKKQAEFEKNSRVETHLIYQGKVISLRTDWINEHLWEIVQHPGAVVVVPVTSDHRIILVKQWRRAIEKIILELPAGKLEKGELPEGCADRELQEEIGFKAGELIPMGGFYSAPGFCDEYLHLFIALDLIPSQLEHDADEAIDLVYVTLEEAWKLIQSHQICDAKTIAGIARYEKWLRK